LEYRQCNTCCNSSTPRPYPATTGNWTQQYIQPIGNKKSEKMLVHTTTYILIGQRARRINWRAEMANWRAANVNTSIHLVNKKIGKNLEWVVLELQSPIK
jgi:hypothetical protein